MPLFSSMGMRAAPTFLNTVPTAVAAGADDGKVMGQGPFGPKYYLQGALAGGICCSITHGALTPVDVVKTRIQLDPVKYNQGFIGGFKQVIAGEGAGALLTGLGPTAQGYFIQVNETFLWPRALLRQVGNGGKGGWRTISSSISAAAPWSSSGRLASHIVAQTLRHKFGRLNRFPGCARAGSAPLRRN